MSSRPQGKWKRGKFWCEVHFHQRLLVLIEFPPHQNSSWRACLILSHFDSHFMNTDILYGGKHKIRVVHIWWPFPHPSGNYFRWNAFPAERAGKIEPAFLTRFLHGMRCINVFLISLKMNSVVEYCAAYPFVFFIRSSSTVFDKHPQKAIQPARHYPYSTWCIVAIYLVCFE